MSFEDNARRTEKRHVIIYAKFKSKMEHTLVSYEEQPNENVIIFFSLGCFTHFRFLGDRSCLAFV